MFYRFTISNKAYLWWNKLQTLILSVLFMFNDVEHFWISVLQWSIQLLGPLFSVWSSWWNWCGEISTGNLQWRSKSSGDAFLHFFQFFERFEPRITKRSCCFDCCFITQILIGVAQKCTLLILENRCCFPNVAFELAFILASVWNVRSDRIHPTYLTIRK